MKKARTKAKLSTKIFYFFVLGVIVSGIFCCVMTLYMQYGPRREANPYSYIEHTIGNAYNLDKNWFWLKNDFTRVAIKDMEVPALPDGELGVYQVELPSYVDDATVLTFITTIDTIFYIDGKLRYEFYALDKNIPGGVVKGVISQFRLSVNDAGKKLTIVRCDDSTNNGTIPRIILGDTYGTFSKLFYEYGYKFIIASVVLVFAVLAMVLGIYMSVRYKNGREVLFLAMGIIIVGLWSLNDNYLLQYVFGTTYIDGVASYIMSIFMPFPFMFFINEVQKHRYDYLYLVIGLIYSINATVLIFMHFFEIADFSSTMLEMNLFIVFLALSVVVTIILDFLKQNIGDYKVISVGMIGLIVFGAGEVFNLNRVGRLDAKLDGVFLMTGMFVLLVSGIYRAIVQVEKVQQEALERSAESTHKSNFLANMSHEIRTPVNAIMGMNEMLLRENLPKEAENYALDIRSASQTLLDLINDILDFSKIEAGKIEFVEQPYELAKLLTDINNMIEIKAKDKNLEYKTKINEKIPGRLIGDETRVRQVLVNVLNNAVKYTKAGTVTFEMDATYSEEKAYLYIRIKDTGIGIKNDDVDILFDKFVRLDETVNKNIEGTGLGLAITKNLVEMMEGSIGVASEYGVGSTFTIIIPQLVADWRPVGSLEATTRKNTDNTKYIPSFRAIATTVLVVDDNPMNLRVMAGLLKKTNVVVDTCLSGAETLDKVTGAKYDIIFLDHMMPEMDGVETFEAMKTLEGNRNLDTPVVILTANAIKGAREEYMKMGFDGYLSKPVHPIKLEELICEFLPAEKLEK